MKSKLTLLNIVLVAAGCATVWQGCVRWNEAQSLRQRTLNVRVKAVQPPPLAALPAPETPPAMKYEDVAKKNLFSADRNDDIVVEPPKAPPKQMPPLPVSTGVMRMPSGVKAFMSEKAGETAHMVKINDTIGEFKIVALDEQNVTFEWDGKQISRRIEDLIDRSNHQQVAATSAPPSPAGPAFSPPPPTPAPSNSSKGQGTELTPTTRACQPGETSPDAMRQRPAGTVEDGYKKVVTNSPFGPVCRWVK